MNVWVLDERKLRRERGERDKGVWVLDERKLRRERGERDKGSEKERDEGFEMQIIQLVG